MLGASSIILPGYNVIPGSRSWCDSSTRITTEYTFYIWFNRGSFQFPVLVSYSVQPEMVILWTRINSGRHPKKPKKTQTLPLIIQAALKLLVFVHPARYIPRGTSTYIPGIIHTTRTIYCCKEPWSLLLLLSTSSSSSSLFFWLLWLLPAHLWCCWCCWCWCCWCISDVPLLRPPINSARLTLTACVLQFLKCRYGARPVSYTHLTLPTKA